MAIRVPTGLKVSLGMIATGYGCLFLGIALFPSSNLLGGFGPLGLLVQLLGLLTLGVWAIAWAVRTAIRRLRRSDSPPPAGVSAEEDRAYDRPSQP